MTLGAKRLRVRIAAVLRHERGRRRYGADLKRAVVEHAFARQGEGATIREIAGELGLSAGLLGKWLRHARLRLKSPSTKPVRGRFSVRQAFQRG